MFDLSLFHVKKNGYKNIFMSLCKFVLDMLHKEYSLIGKIGSFKLQISSSSLDALAVI